MVVARIHLSAENDGANPSLLLSRLLWLCKWKRGVCECLCTYVFVSGDAEHSVDGTLAVFDPMAMCNSKIVRTKYLRIYWCGNCAYTNPKIINANTMEICARSNRHIYNIPDKHTHALTHTPFLWCDPLNPFIYLFIHFSLSFFLSFFRWSPLDA